MTSTVLSSVTKSVMEIVLNRPDVLNSFNRPMARELQAALHEAGERDDVRAVLLTGAGRAFCAGQDLAEAIPKEGPAPPIADIVEESYNPTVRLIWNLEKPVVCAVNGVAAGAGANIALACDFVIASEKASFIQSFANIGLVPDSGGTFTIPRLVGMARAKAMTMLAEKVTAAAALEMGLIYRTASPEALMEEATAFAAHLATQPTRGLGLTKRALHESMANDLPQQLEVERKLQAEAGETHDYREGVTAFLEKRKPAFRGS